jgi:hypothetical protein
VEHEKRHITQYLEGQAPDETVVQLEKVASERVLGHRHDVWDVHTDQARWWVITTPTNLYLQEDLPSMDQALSLHIGLTARVISRQQPTVGDEEQDRLAGSWRKWQQAADAAEQADEAEEFQSVGMRCREALLAFVREVADDEMVPAGTEAPKRGDFLYWSEYIAQAIASGESSEAIRTYLKMTARGTWGLVRWLTHEQNATRFDSDLSVAATENVLATFSMALVRFERGAPDRCPVCSSYRLTSDYRPEVSTESPYVTLCESCGWEDTPDTYRAWSDRSLRS